MVSSGTSSYKAIVPFLLHLPYTNADGDSWMMDVTAQPKVEAKPYYPPVDPPVDPVDPPVEPVNPPAEPVEADDAFEVEFEIEIPDEEVPLAAVPKTGDMSGLWNILSGISAAGMFLLGRKRKNEE